MSLLYLTGHKHQYIKLRITYPGEHKEAREKKIAAVLARLGVMMKAKSK